MITLNFIRYGREEMLALYEKGLPAPSSLASFPIYSDQALPPLALTPATEEEVSLNHEIIVYNN